MRYIPLEVESCEKVVAEDGSIFRVGNEVTVVAEKNLNDRIVGGILTNIIGNYVSISVPEYTLVVRSSAVGGK